MFKEAECYDNNQSHITILNRVELSCHYECVADVCNARK